MVKTAAYDISKSKEQVADGNEGAFFKIHLNISKNSHKKIFFQVIMVVIGVFLAIGALEIGLRVFEKREFTLDPCVSLDKDFHHVLIPNKNCRFKTEEWDVENIINSTGMRDEEINLKKDEIGVFRILALGDSFTMGHGVKIKESYINILENNLNSFQKGKKIEIINAAVFGYSPIIHWLYLSKKGLSFEPDAVILFFTLTDFWEDRKRFEELTDSYPGISEKDLMERLEDSDVEFKFEFINMAAGQNIDQLALAPNVSYELKTWLRSNFKIYATLVDFIKKRNQPVAQDVIFQGDPDRDIVALVRGEKITQENWQDLWKLPVYNLGLISDLLDEMNIKFVVVLIPEAVQVNDKEWPNKTALGLSSHFNDTRGPYQNELIRRLKGKKIEFIDLLPRFRESEIFPLYFSQDGHFRESGHQLAANILFETFIDTIFKD